MGLYEKADVVLHATSWFLSIAESQSMEFCENGVDVVSTNEELAFPWFSHRESAERLDQAAKKTAEHFSEVGVNPGFLDFTSLELP